MPNQSRRQALLGSWVFDEYRGIVSKAVVVIVVKRPCWRKHSRRHPNQIFEPVTIAPASSQILPESVASKYPVIESRSCKPSMNSGPVENSGEVLLAHASLYVLAEKWGVNSLKMLVLSKLPTKL
jgi:hypothetical protein